MAALFHLHVAAPGIAISCLAVGLFFAITCVFDKSELSRSIFNPNTKTRLRLSGRVIPTLVYKNEKKVKMTWQIHSISNDKVDTRQTQKIF